MVNQLVVRGQLTHHLGSALRSGEHGLSSVPDLLRQVLEAEAWKERTVWETGEHIPGFSSFDEYAQANPPKGLGASVDLIRRILDGDEATLTLLERARQRPVGRPTEIVLNQDNSEKKRDHRDDLRRRLREQFPELHARVLAGELTVTAAAIEAGIYPARLAVPMDDMDKLARTLRKHLTENQRQELLTLLEEAD